MLTIFFHRLRGSFRPQLASIFNHKPDGIKPNCIVPGFASKMQEKFSFYGG
jgi:hypothetical protein